MNKRHAFIAIWLLSLSAGCQQPMLSVDDTYFMSGKPSSLEARVERMANGKRAGVAAVPVHFFVHEKPVGTALTDAMGEAKLTAELPPEATHYRAEARVSGEALVSEGLVFNFPRGRTVIICDIDETISMTHYRELVFDADDEASRSFKYAAPRLTKLSERFGLIYLTARPVSLLEKTKRWLEANGFPRAAVVTTPGLSQSIGVQSFKAQQIARLKKVLGTVGIGIGNAYTDSEAYAMQHLLTLIIDDHDDNKFRSHAIVLRNWPMVQAFFDANQEVLADYAKLEAAMDDERMILRPIIHYQRAQR